MEHANATMYRRVMDAFQGGDIESLKDALAPDVRWHEAGNPTVIEGRDAVLARMPGGGPLEVKVESHEVLANDEHVIALSRATFTKPDGTTISYPAVDVLHVNEGVVTERWAFMDACPSDVTSFFETLG
ncbi:MAG: nuclear transport factor 2 family protein [Mycobacteriales bacterium]